MDVGPDWHLRRKLQELLAIATCQVGDRADLSLHPQELIGKRGDVAHVNAGTDHNPARIERFERGRHQRTDWREDQGGIEGLWRRGERAARPFGPEAARERLLFRIGWRGEGKDAESL